ncbi:hypothetical protein DFR86_11050 [Acidianus sulfidivorans JP7]|uniref:Uncharacterized protein n=1 Tax=Acidianus sulfidivorans JP7 TaxID=619593 RepID=A0A2U9IPN9_9CREN|nr:hypothetical protein [Acidianus sulfidivorans]AWR98018.1 hypothetical protein DFR86_11050 [Acidianus sulfidivorans JP7]
MIKDNCGCIIERKYASDFLARQIFRLSKIPKDYKKIGEIEIEGRRAELYYDKTSQELRYKSTECPLLIITLEALCETFANHKNLDLNSAINAINNIKGLTRNDFVNSVIKEVVRKIEENSLYS